MLIYHQCGHNFVWNLQSLRDDGVGEGVIISPVNVKADRIEARISRSVLDRSFLDPQFYLPHDSKNNLESYPFFPANVLGGFNTTEYEAHAFDVARACLTFQHDLGLRYLVIPTRYFDDLPTDYLDQLGSLFVEPFLEARAAAGIDKPILLTVIAKGVHLEAGVARDELLSWATSFAEISGVYLILDHRSNSKQIKNPAFLAGALRFVRALRLNGLEVHIGYGGLEGLLYSIADPTSVTVGSYENLRSFGTLRLESRERGPQRGPRPRIFSGRLLQWLEDTALPPIRELVPDWVALFDESPYREFLLDQESALNFQRAEIYKHYFYIFAGQVAALPALDERLGYVREAVIGALEAFDMIRTRTVLLDSDSDGSPLPAWMNAMAMYEAHPE